MAETQQELDHKSGGGLFARMWRTAAAEHVKNPRYPSIVDTGGGALLLMFTDIPATESEPAVLALSSSNDNGRTWSQPQTAYTAPSGIPKALGTMTRLRTGGLITPFLDDQLVRILASDDDGKTWQASDPIDCAPLQLPVPYGRILEYKGELLMPLYGKLALGGKLAPCSGFLRSKDAAKSWERFSVIACDRQSAEIEYGPTAIHADPNGHLLAMISVGSQFLHRSLSTDGGRTWSGSEQRLLATKPVLVPVGSTLACVNQSIDQFGQDGLVRAQFSENLFDSWRCDRHLEYNIRSDYMSAIALDDNRLLIVHDRNEAKPMDQGRGTIVTEGIEVALMQRNPATPPVTNTILSQEKRIRWELAFKLPELSNELGYGWTAMTPDGRLLSLAGNRMYEISDLGRKVRQIAEGPPSQEDSFDSGVFSVLSSGRWITAVREDELEDWRGTHTYLGRGDDGYDDWKLSGVKGAITFRIFFSDDEGHTWQGGEHVVNYKPLVWAHSNGRVIELSDGTLVLPLFGSFNDEDTSSRIDSCGVLRSTDGGQSWGDFSLIAHDRENKNIAYNEVDIQPMPDGSWVAAIRTEWRDGPYGHPWSTSFCFSTDQGRTWTKPELGYVGNVPDMALLPDGGLVVAAAAIPRIVFSYDGGHTWSQEVPAVERIGASSYAGVELLDDNHLFVYGRWRGRDARVYRRVSQTTSTSVK